MSLVSLDNLVKSGHLKLEPMNQLEFAGLLHSGQARLKDAGNISLALESRFDLGYNAAHSLALAALRWHGYRSNNRYLVFQALPHTVGLGSEVWRVLAKCHECRNIAEYEGHLEVSQQLLEDLLIATHALLSKVNTLR
jgi:hypothetical protein